MSRRHVPRGSFCLPSSHVADASVPAPRHGSFLGIITEAELRVASLDPTSLALSAEPRLLRAGVEPTCPRLKAPPVASYFKQMVAVAELEAGLISVRTKAAL